MTKKIPGMEGSKGGFSPHVSTVDSLSTVQSKKGDADVRKGGKMSYKKSSHKY